MTKNELEQILAEQEEYYEKEVNKLASINDDISYIIGMLRTINDGLESYSDDCVDDYMENAANALYDRIHCGDSPLNTYENGLAKVKEQLEKIDGATAPSTLIGND